MKMHWDVVFKYNHQIGYSIRNTHPALELGNGTAYTLHVRHAGNQHNRIPVTGTAREETGNSWSTLALM
jgi:hypothetical protein